MRPDRICLPAFDLHNNAPARKQVQSLHVPRTERGADRHARRMDILHLEPRQDSVSWPSGLGSSLTTPSSAISSTGQVLEPRVRRFRAWERPDLFAAGMRAASGHCAAEVQAGSAATAMRGWQLRGPHAQPSFITGAVTIGAIAAGPGSWAKGRVMLRGPDGDQAEVAEGTKKCRRNLNIRVPLTKSHGRSTAGPGWAKSRLRQARGLYARRGERRA